MPDRILPERIRTDSAIDTLSSFEEVCYYRLLVSADENGCLDARPRVIASMLFPLKDIRDCQIQDALRKLASAGLVRFVNRDDDGQLLVRLSRWDWHLRAGSRISGMEKAQEADPRGGEQAPDASPEHKYDDGASLFKLSVESPLYDRSRKDAARHIIKSKIGMTPDAWNEFRDFAESLPDDLIIRAVDKAVSKDSVECKWQYVKKILDSYIANGIRTVADADDANRRWKEEKHGRQNASADQSDHAGRTGTAQGDLAALGIVDHLL